MFEPARNDPSWFNGLKLSPEALLHQFIEDGYLRLPTLVPATLVKEVRQVIEDSVFGEQHEWYGEKRKDKRLEAAECSGSWLPQLLSLLQPFVEKIIGPAAAEVSDIQYSIMESGRPRSEGWHIDGTWLALQQNSFRPIPFFRLLVGVYLSDLVKPERGNLIVHPKGHHAVAAHFRSIPPDSVLDVGEAVRDLSRIELPPALQILAEPGDIIVAHPLLPHSIAANKGPDRPALYLRLGRLTSRGLPTLSDIYTDFII